MTKQTSLHVRFERQSELQSMDERRRSLAELGSMMRAERERHRLSHSQFAQALGVQAGDILRLERGVLMSTLKGSHGFDAN